MSGDYVEWGNASVVTKGFKNAFIDSSAGFDENEQDILIKDTGHVEIYDGKKVDIFNGVYTYYENGYPSPSGWNDISQGTTYYPKPCWYKESEMNYPLGETGQQDGVFIGRVGTEEITNTDYTYNYGVNVNDSNDNEILVTGYEWDSTDPSYLNGVYMKDESSTKWTHIYDNTVTLEVGTTPTNGSYRWEFKKGGYSVNNGFLDHPSPTFPPLGSWSRNENNYCLAHLYVNKIHSDPIKNRLFQPIYVEASNVYSGIYIPIKDEDTNTNIWKHVKSNFKKKTPSEFDIKIGLIYDPSMNDYPNIYIKNDGGNWKWHFNEGTTVKKLKYLNLYHEKICLIYILLL